MDDYIFKRTGRWSTRDSRQRLFLTKHVPCPDHPVLLGLGLAAWFRRHASARCLDDDCYNTSCFGVLCKTPPDSNELLIPNQTEPNIETTCCMSSCCCARVQSIIAPTKQRRISVEFPPSPALEVPPSLEKSKALGIAIAVSRQVFSGVPAGQTGQPKKD